MAGLRHAVNLANSPDRSPYTDCPEERESEGTFLIAPFGLWRKTPGETTDDHERPND